MTSKKKDFEAAVKRHFESIAPLVDQELKLIAEAFLSSTAKFILVEYDSPRFADAFAVVAWLFDSKGNSMSKGQWFLKGKKIVVVPPAIYDAPKYESIEPWSVASELFKRWLVSRWKKIDGADQCVAFIGHHDSYFKTDLSSGKSISWDEIVKIAKKKEKKGSISEVNRWS